MNLTRQPRDQPWNRITTNDNKSGKTAQTKIQLMKPYA